ncbi:MAG: hypothetical protein KTR30_23325 [Saprospiraceae bacterium]|nr:hypothetical protein [Saprospiraceae bacterium]
MKPFTRIKKKLIFVTLILSSTAGWQPMVAQTYEWEIDKHEKKEQEKQQAIDQYNFSLDKRWEIKLSYGKWSIIKSAKSTEEQLFSLPAQMDVWQLQGTWHFSEVLTADVSLGFQIEKDIPSRSSIFSILSGDDIEIEGSGGGFIPIDIGLRYYLLKDRFRPYLGVSNGFIMIRSQYTLAEGSLANGIVRTDYSFEDRQWFGEVNSGFDYRAGKSIQLNLNASYTWSQAFTQPVGGFLNYEGIGISMGLAILL